MPAYDLIADRNGANIVLVLNVDNVRRAYIGTGAAADAFSLLRNDKILTISFFHLESTGTDNFLTHTNAETAADTSIRRFSRVDTILFCQRDDRL